MARILSPGEVLSRVQRCEASIERLTFGSSQFERAVWLNTKNVVSSEASNIRPTDRGVACLLDTAAGALGGFLLAPPKQLEVIKALATTVLRFAEDAALELQFHLRAGAVK